MSYTWKTINIYYNKLQKNCSKIHSYEKKIGKKKHEILFYSNPIGSLYPICTLMDIIIADLTHTNIMQPTSMIITHETMMAVQNKIHYITSTNRWLQSLCYWVIWVFSFWFWFIFYHLCIDCYCMSSTIFFNPFDACLLLLKAHIHNHVMCTNHYDSLINCYT
jgi:hypothetical protein